MGIVVILVVGIALLVGFAMLPTVTATILGYTAAPATPLYDIVQLLPICFIGLVVLGAIWVVGKRL